MSEVCKNCPISINDPDAPLLSAAVSHMTDMKRFSNNGFMYSKSPVTPEEVVELARDETYEDALKELGFSPKKIKLAQKCARMILWDICEFHRGAETA